MNRPMTGLPGTTPEKFVESVEDVDQPDAVIIGMGISLVNKKKDSTIILDSS